MEFHIRYIMVIIVIKYYTIYSILLTVDLKCFHHKKMELCDMIEALKNVMVVMILQYLNISNQHIVYLKFTNVICQYISR